MMENVGVWGLEFLLRHDVSDDVIKYALSSFPLPPDSSVPLRLKKLIVLRTLHSAAAVAVSEDFLDHLETLEAIDVERGRPIPASLKAAYLAVCLECTLRCLREGEADSFAGAVGRIWRGRFEAVEGKSQMMNDEFIQWKARLEAALVDQSEQLTLAAMTDTKAEAMRSVRAYLNEAFRMSGTPFLQRAAAISAAVGPNAEAPAVAPSHELNNVAADGHVAVDDSARDDGSADEAAISPGPNRETSQAILSEHIGDEDAVDDDVGNDVAGDDHSRDNGAGKEAAEGPANSKKVVTYKRKDLPSRRHRGIKIADTEEPGVRTSYDPLPSPLVDKVHKALKSSSLELHRAVEDPLPAALKIADSLMPDGDSTVLPPESMPPDHTGEDDGAADPSVHKTTSDGAPSNMGNTEAPYCETARPKRSLMEKHTSAQTYQWEDSSPDGSSDEKDRPQLPTPKGIAVSPLRMISPEIVPKRRRRKPWSLEEEDALRAGVNRFGQGKWKLILQNYSDIFDERTEVDLKDKWRNMTH